MFLRQLLKPGVGEHACNSSYVGGPITPATWNVEAESFSLPSSWDYRYCYYSQLINFFIVIVEVVPTPQGGVVVVVVVA